MDAALLALLSNLGSGSGSGSMQMSFGSSAQGVDPKSALQHVKDNFEDLKGQLKTLLEGDAGKHWCKFVMFYIYQVNKGNGKRGLPSIKSAGNYFSEFVDIAREGEFTPDICQKVVDKHTPELLLALAVLINDVNGMKTLSIKRSPLAHVGAFATFVDLGSSFVKSALRF